jgi:hypothetical protein
MTNQAFPITPPPELVVQWYLAAKAMPVDQWVTDVATAAAQWGWDKRGAANEAELQQRADQELEACCEWLRSAAPAWERQLRAARRPKPPSLKEQALLAIDVAVADGRLSPDVSKVVRSALKALPND